MTPLRGCVYLHLWFPFSDRLYASGPQSRVARPSLRSSPTRASPVVPPPFTPASPTSSLRSPLASLGVRFTAFPQVLASLAFFASLSPRFARVQLSGIRCQTVARTPKLTRTRTFASLNPSRKDSSLRGLHFESRINFHHMVPAGGPFRLKLLSLRSTGRYSRKVGTI